MNQIITAKHGTQRYGGGRSQAYVLQAREHRLYSYAHPLHLLTAVIIVAQFTKPLTKPRAGIGIPLRISLLEITQSTRAADNIGS